MAEQTGGVIASSLLCPEVHQLLCTQLCSPQQCAEQLIQLIPIILCHDGILIGYSCHMTNPHAIFMYNIALLIDLAARGDCNANRCHTTHWNFNFPQSM